MCLPKKKNLPQFPVPRFAREAERERSERERERGREQDESTGMVADAGGVAPPPLRLVWFLQHLGSSCSCLFSDREFVFIPHFRIYFRFFFEKKSSIAVCLGQYNGNRFCLSTQRCRFKSCKKNLRKNKYGALISTKKNICRSHRYRSIHCHQNLWHICCHRF